MLVGAIAQCFVHQQQVTLGRCHFSFCLTTHDSQKNMALSNSYSTLAPGWVA